MALPPANPSTFHITTPASPITARRPSQFTPTSKSKQVKLEVWLLWLGSPGVNQLNILPGNITGLPLVF